MSYSDSITYQVLSKGTAFIGVIKQSEKIIGEIKEVAIQSSYLKKQSEKII